MAALLPNSATALALYFAALQTGLYMVPVNWHLVGAEIAYILADSAASAFLAHERFAAAAAEAAASGVKCLLRRRRHDGFQPLAALGADTAGRPRSRTAGAPMLYTSGTSGRPKGVRRPLTGADPDEGPLASSGFFAIFGIRPHDANVHICGSPLYHTAVLNFATISIQLGHPVVLMDRIQPEELLALIERHRVTHSHMVPTQFRRLLALPARRPRPLRHVLAADHDPRRGALPREVKRRCSTGGAGHRGVYAATEGGGTWISATEWLGHPGTVGRPWPCSRGPGARPRLPAVPTGSPAWST